MAGPLAEKIAKSLAGRYPDACRDTLKDVTDRLSMVEEEYGVVSTRAIALARDDFAFDARIHGGVMLYAHNGGRVGDSSGFI